jgi:hypothetical protein
MQAVLNQRPCLRCHELVKIFQTKAIVKQRYLNGDYDPMTHGGRMCEPAFDLKATFRGATLYIEAPTNSFMFLGRSDQQADPHQAGCFWHTKPFGFEGVAAMRHELALSPEQNSAAFHKILAVPPDIHCFRGIVAAQGKFPGGDEQVWIPDKVVQALLPASAQFLQHIATTGLSKAAYDTFVRDTKDAREASTAWWTVYREQTAQVHYDAKLVNWHRELESLQQQLKEQPSPAKSNAEACLVSIAKMYRAVRKIQAALTKLDKASQSEPNLPGDVKGANRLFGRWTVWRKQLRNVRTVVDRFQEGQERLLSFTKPSERTVEQWVDMLLIESKHASRIDTWNQWQKLPSQVRQLLSAGEGGTNTPLPADCVNRNMVIHDTPFLTAHIRLKFTRTEQRGKLTIYWYTLFIEYTFK